MVRYPILSVARLPTPLIFRYPLHLRSFFVRSVPYAYACLKVHKNENFFGFDFEFCTISLLVMHKRFWGTIFLIGLLWAELRLFRVVVLRLRGMKKFSR